MANSDLSHKIQLTADTSQYNAEMDKAEKRSQQLDRVLKQTGEDGAQGMDSVGLAARKTTSQVGDLIASVVSLGNALKLGSAVASAAKLGETFLAAANKMSALTAGTNMGTASLARWAFTATRLGADANTAQSELAALQKEIRGERYSGQASQTLNFARSQGINVAGLNAQQVMQALNVRYNTLQTPEAKERFAALAQNQGGLSDNAMQIITAPLGEMQKAVKDSRTQVKDFTAALAPARSAAAAFGASLLNVGQTALPAYVGATSAVILGLQALDKGLKTTGSNLESVARYTAIAATALGGFSILKPLIELLPGVLRVFGRFLGPVGVAITVFEALNFAVEKLTGKGAFYYLGQALDGLLTGFKKMLDWMEGLPGVGSIIKTLRTDPAGTVKTVVKEAYQNSGLKQGVDRLTAPAVRSDTPSPGLSGGQAATHMKLMTDLRAQGFDKQTAFAIATNIMAESGGNASAHNAAGGGRGATGLMQWRGARADELAKFSGKKSAQDTSYEDQIRFIAHEAAGTERRNYAKVKMAQNVAQATAAVSDLVERHGNAAETARRVALSQRYLGAQGQPGLTGGSSTTTNNNGNTVNIQQQYVTLPNVTNATQFREQIGTTNRMTLVSPYKN